MMTTKEILARCTTDTIVSKILGDIKNGNKREIRNSIELGLIFSKGQIHKEFFEIARKITNHPQNRYGELIKKAVVSVDLSVLKTVIINLGVTAFSFGAEKIRFAYENGKEYLSWLQSLDINRTSDTTPQSQVNKYNDEGVFVFTINNISSLQHILTLCDIAQGSKQSVFFARLGNECLDDLTVIRIKECKNIIPIIDVDCFSKKSSDNICLLLKNNSLLFGFFKSYSEIDDENEEKSFIEGISANGCLFGVYAGEKSICSYVTPTFYSTMCAIRINGNTPIILCDYHNDSKGIQDLILHKKHFFKSF